MEEQVMYDIAWRRRYISLKEVVKGHVYVSRNASRGGVGIEADIMMYLGRIKSGLHVFYHFAKARLRNVPNNSFVTFTNYDAQVNGIRQIIAASMDTQAYSDSIIKFDKNPRIIGEFPVRDYADVYLNWYHKSFTADDNVPEISAGKITTDHVKTSDLVLGGLYYTNPNGNVFIYLGRRSDGRFIWYPVYGREHLRVALRNIDRLYANSVVTASNRRCKPVACIHTDDYFYNQYLKDIICELAKDDILHLAEKAFKSSPSVVSAGIAYVENR